MLSEIMRCYVWHLKTLRIMKQNLKELSPKSSHTF